MPDPQDLKWIRAARKGDQDAFTALYQKYHRRLYNCFLRSNGDNTEDVVQEAFLMAFRKLDHYKGDSQFFTWLYRIAVNAMLMSRRKKRVAIVAFPELLLEREVVPEFPYRDMKLELTPERMELFRLVDELPPGQKMIYDMHEIGGMQHSEIAQKLNCTIGNSKSQLFKARNVLREELSKKRSKSGIFREIRSHYPSKIV